jgi:hypothetical protein
VIQVVEQREVVRATAVVKQFNRKYIAFVQAAGIRRRRQQRLVRVQRVGDRIAVRGQGETATHRHVVPRRRVREGHRAVGVRTVRRILVGAIDLVGAADNNTISNNTIEANFSDGIRFGDPSNTGNQISNNSILNSGDDGARLSGDGLSFDNNTVRLSQQLSASACGLELNAVTNSTVSANLIENNGNQGGICLVDAASTGNTISPFNTIATRRPRDLQRCRRAWATPSPEFTVGQCRPEIDLDRDGITPNDPGDGDTRRTTCSTSRIYNVGIALGQVVVTGETAACERRVLCRGGRSDRLRRGVNFLGSGSKARADSSRAIGANDPSANQFTFSLPIRVLTCGDTITATATDPARNTSEFSLNFTTPYCSLSFDGSDDIVGTMNLPFLTSFTVEAWVYRTADLRRPGDLRL